MSLINENNYLIKDDYLFPEYLQNKKILKKSESKQDIIKQKWLSLGIDIYFDFYKVLTPYDSSWKFLHKEKTFYNKKAKKNITAYTTIYDIISKTEKAFIKDYKRSKNKIFSEYPEYVQEILYKYTDSIYALPMLKTSNVLRLDIDNHTNKYLNPDTQKALHILMKTLKYPECFIEQSVKNSYHIYIPFNRTVVKEDVKKFLNSLKEKHNITCIDFPDYLRVPGTLSYASCKIDSKKDLMKLIKTAECDYIVEEEDQLQYIKNISKSNYDLIYTEKEKNKYNAKNINYNRNNFIDKKSLEEKYNSIEIGYCNRHHNMLTMCSYALHLNYSTTKVMEDIYKRDTGSKDLKKWSSDYLLEQIENIYDNFKKDFKINYNKNTDYVSDCFCSNIYLVPNKIQNSLDPLIKQIINDLGIIKINKKKSLYKPTKNLLLEMIGQFIYDSENAKNINCDNPFTKDQKILYTQFSQTWFCLFKKHYNISNCDIYRIFKTIIKLDIFNQKYYSYITNKNKKIKLSWLYVKYKSCKQFYIDINNDKDSIINKVITIIKQIKNKYNYIFNNNSNFKKLYIIYIYDINYISKVFNNRFFDCIIDTT